jgi:hypothetical protein
MLRIRDTVYLDLTNLYTTRQQGSTLEYSTATLNMVRAFLVSIYL